MQDLINSQNCFTIWNDELVDRLDVSFYSPDSKQTSHLRETLEQTHSVVALNDIVTEYSSGEWGASESADDSLKPMRILRNTNFVNQGNLSYEDCPERYVSLSKFQKNTLLKNDILVEKSGGSPDQPVGRAAIFERENGDPYGFSNFLMRLRIDEKQFVPKFVFLYLKILFQLGYTESLQSHTTGIRNLRVKDFLNIPIPVIPKDTQLAIITTAEESNCFQVDSSGKEIFAGVNALLKRELSLSLTPGQKSKLWFAAWSNEISDRLDASPYSPDRLNAVEAIKSGEFPVQPLTNLVEFQKRQVKSVPESLPYIGLENIASNTGIYTPSAQPKDSISGATIFSAGDVLFAKLRPYLNKVYLAEFDGVCSTEFHVLRCKHGVLPEYLRAFLASDFVVRQTSHLTTGNTLPRLQTADILALLIPVPDTATQQSIASSIKHIKDEAERQSNQVEQKKQRALKTIESLIFG